MLSAPHGPAQLQSVILSWHFAISAQSGSSCLKIQGFLKRHSLRFGTTFIRAVRWRANSKMEVFFSSGGCYLGMYGLIGSLDPIVFSFMLFLETEILLCSPFLI